MRARRFIPVAAATAVATLTPLITATAPASAASSAGTATTSASAAQQLDWKRCSADQPANFQCATLKVPLDYKNPGGKKIDVAVSRIAAADPATRRGVMLFNPGGPGGSGLNDPLDWGQRLPKDVLDRYDLIGFDPRGVGASNPVTCGTAPAERKLFDPYSKAAFPASVAWAKGFADKCRTKYGTDLQHFTTRNTARDMDAIRAALGEKKINYIGVSYGTYLGAVYTQMFPHRSDRMVLDSAVDPKLAWRDMLRAWASGAEPAYDRWLTWASKENARLGFGSTPQAVAKTFWDLVARADREPLRIGETTFDGAQVRQFMRPLFFYKEEGAQILQLFKDAADGKPVPPAPDLTMPDADISAFHAVACGDAAAPRNPATYARDSVRDAKRYPVFGDHTSNITPCAFWDRPAEPTTKVNNSVKSLIVQAEWDSQTPLFTAQGMHRALKGSRMVTVDEGETHGVYRYGISECADNVTTKYLVTGELPGKDVTCAANPSAGPAAKKQGQQRWPSLPGIPRTPADRF
ncbi:alpha/beta hydrolase [Streptomyces sp. NPDC020875]|uniref:alpha/beta hydrolase n=1 Tax=Streptomyces sp. NPDC020875 TaxID=3154898 RepID=UPI00340FA483